jgi:hypothetical protein
LEKRVKTPSSAQKNNKTSSDPPAVRNDGIHRQRQLTPRPQRPDIVVPFHRQVPEPQAGRFLGPGELRPVESPGLRGSEDLTRLLFFSDVREELGLEHLLLPDTGLSSEVVDLKGGSELT